MTIVKTLEIIEALKKAGKKNLKPEP
jgi:hypothetical protein